MTRQSVATDKVRGYLVSHSALVSTSVLIVLVVFTHLAHSTLAPLESCVTPAHPHEFFTFL